MKLFSKIDLKTTIRFLLLITIPICLCSHDLYVKMNTYFLKPNKETTLSLYNGTFEKSENIITRDRMLDASLVYNGKRLAIDESQWTDKDSTITQFKFAPIETGTYVAGVSTKARNIELSAEKFNNYLKHDGVLDMLEYRKANELLEQDAIESYQKHVKAIFQVGKETSEDWNVVLGYPIEFVPLANPYGKYTGDKLEVQLLLDGKPLTNQLVYADYIKVHHNHDHGNHHNHEHKDETHEHKHDGSHSHGDKEHEHKHDEDSEAHSHTDGKQLRTDKKGIVSIDLSEDGIYYLRTIHMINIEDHETLTHESKWATLTFEVTHAHNNHTHKHEDENHIPTWVFLAGSVLIIGILFLVFKK